jgi:formylglycine-generating enzyme required for sulfatase activity
LSSRARAVSLPLAVTALLLAGFQGEGARVKPSEKVTIPAGTFVRGSDTAAVRYAISICRSEHLLGHSIGAGEAETFAPEMPSIRVHVPAFEIDRHEVTRAEYARCERAGACVPPRLGAGDPRIGRPRHPVVGVSAHDAEDYCRFAGGRLPSDDEWEKAARGDLDGRSFPWGQLWDKRLANHGGEERRGEASDGERFLSPVGSYPEGASPYGVLDMAGNAWEWTSSAFTPGMRAPRPTPGAAVRSIRGGSFRATAVMLRVAFRAGLPAFEHAPDVGFRCAYDLR